MKKTNDIGKVVVKKTAKKRVYQVRNEEIEKDTLFGDEEPFQDKRFKMDYE